MANYNKSFNFRNGVQVDNDNFVVNANGLVGIGTTIPTEFLDVYGTSKFNSIIKGTDITLSGLTSTRVLNVGIVSIASGIVTAISGIVTYYGDGGNLINLPTSQWVDVDPGFGFTSIYSAGNVGIATTIPTYTFQVGNNPNTASGVGFNSTGDIRASGIITANSFSGFGTNLLGISAANITNGTLNNLRLPQNISVTGIITANSFSGFGTNLLGISAANITNGTLTNSRLPQNIDVTGIITANSFSGNITGIASTARDLISTANITINSITSGLSTVSTRLYAESIGVGTNSPSSDIHIRRSSISKLQVTSNSAEAIIAIGRSTTLTGSNGALIFGNTAGIYPYSNSKTLDIVNYDTGSINQYLHYGSAGIGTGNFNWFYGQSPLDSLMSLTYQGNLGLGITNPTVKLQVSGIASVISLVTQSITATGNVVATGAGTSTSIRTLYVYGGKSQILNSDGTEIFPTLNTSNVNIASGISTFFDINVTNNGIFGGKIGIGLTLPPLEYLHIGGNYIEDPEGAVVISSAGIGIGTTAIRYGAGIDATAVDANLGIVGIGTTVPSNPGQTTLFVGRSSVFHGNVGIGTTNQTDKLTVRGGDISVGVNTTNGLILTAANGNKFRLFVTNTGVLSTTPIP